MKKYLTAALIASALTLTMAMTSFAGQWQENTQGWWYQNDDGSYPTNSWQWIDGRNYYFDSQGYCLMDTVTPDGYTVDASGAWIVNGVVQIQAQLETEVSLTGIYSGTFADGQGGADLEIRQSNEQADAIFDVAFSGSYGFYTGETEGYIVPYTDGSDGWWEYYDNNECDAGNYKPSMLLNINKTTHTITVTSLDGKNFGGMYFPGFDGTYTK